MHLHAQRWHTRHRLQSLWLTHGFRLHGIILFSLKKNFFFFFYPSRTSLYDFIVSKIFYFYLSCITFLVMEREKTTKEGNRKIIYDFLVLLILDMWDSFSLFIASFSLFNHYSCSAEESANNLPIVTNAWVLVKNQSEQQQEIDHIYFFYPKGFFYLP